MIQDLHSHTYYSFCGADRPEQIVEAAIACGVDLFGISDHNYGIGFARWDLFQAGSAQTSAPYERTLTRYLDHMRLIQRQYAGKIQILCGIELCTRKDARLYLPESADISSFDYCLIENLDEDGTTVTEGDLFAYAKRCRCPAGVAHTDLFRFLAARGEKAADYFRRMADENIFWEMNVNYDSTHAFHEHEYVREFFRNPRQQEIVRESGVRLSVGFDGHRVADYRPDRVADACRKITALGIPLAFE